MIVLNKQQIYFQRIFGASFVLFLVLIGKPEAGFLILLWFIFCLVFAVATAEVSSNSTELFSDEVRFIHDYVCSEDSCTNRIVYNGVDFYCFTHSVLNYTDVGDLNCFKEGCTEKMDFINDQPYCTKHKFNVSEDGEV